MARGARLRAWTPNVAKMSLQEYLAHVAFAALGASIEEAPDAIAGRTTAAEDREIERLR
jgi:hypothetical protein